MTPAALHEFLRATARVSALLFLPAFALAAGSVPARRLRDRLLTAFGVSHTVHLAGIIVFASRFWPDFAHEFPPPVLLLASTVFAAVYFAAGNGLAGVCGRRALGPAWMVATAEYLVWIVFLVELAAHSPRQPLLYAPFVILAAATGGMRIGRRRAQTASAAAAS